MGETDKPIVDPAIREAFMAMYRIVPEAHWDEFEVMRQIMLGSGRNRKLPEPILRLVVPVLAAKINQLPPAMQDWLFGLASEDLRAAVKRER